MKDKVFSKLKPLYTLFDTWLKIDAVLVFFSSFSLLLSWNLLTSTRENLLSLTFLGTISFIMFYLVFHFMINKFNPTFRQLSTDRSIHLSIAGLFGISNTSKTPTLKNNGQKKTTNNQKTTKGSAIPLYPLAKGGLKEIEEVDDEIYSKKTLGDGFAIAPSEGKVHSPVNGKIVSLFPTKHAIGIKDENDIEYLVHMGIDTIDLNGHGFQTFVEQDQKVKAGDLLTEMDLDYISTHRKNTDIIFITLSQDLIDSLEIDEDKKVDLDESIGQIVLK
ncbi:PTS glucose transporter subunit IIA [Tetragenococcus koreensis]|uniref:PTS EIIA type-1 domain-containing protein n=1 Tax=Tetragenococcus koreensis TaxID=290335 RepID=A0AAN4RLJ7_9ENTE|nr:PTS glucose transporter subunit IIA [Tetragenococcus koreensis]AYW44608.1 hypothetical protein C7K43_00960 [Tetragenococcus koreensis]MCF1586322.1 PTS glucose transporter subunit IIA [Tetragenococcus koreensis]MCF1615642.1 PTS glucose transporter subunit IIA [Tetragenococcus koreensis]MCF1620783.1 PTS glucose transporter subunit IIA [Tetragenococcus koreensis]MCF1625439.1 PTS glucose transporter subunit IIA [Tetragenococcus koreensis]